MLCEGESRHGPAAEAWCCGPRSLTSLRPITATVLWRSAPACRLRLAPAVRVPHLGGSVAEQRPTARSVVRTVLCARVPVIAAPCTDSATLPPARSLPVGHHASSHCGHIVVQPHPAAPGKTVPQSTLRFSRRRGSMSPPGSATCRGEVGGSPWPVTVQAKLRHS